MDTQNMQNRAPQAEIIAVNQTEVLEALNRSEVDMQISTAKKYPRDIQRSLNSIKTLATLDQETAMDCFYTLSRSGSHIEGISVRLAEVIASQWGNLRVQTRIIGNDGRTITAQGVCIDLETNFGVLVETKRRITDRLGRTFSEDMQVVTGNAASAIAFRNAVLKVVPRAVTASVVKDIKSVAMGQGLDMTTRRKNLLAYFGKLGITQEQVLAYCGVKRIEEVDSEMLFELAGVKNAIYEGTTTAEEAFSTEANEMTKRMSAAARTQAEERQQRVAQSMARAKGAKQEGAQPAGNDATEPKENSSKE